MGAAPFGHYSPPGFCTASFSRDYLQFRKHRGIKFITLNLPEHLGSFTSFSPFHIPFVSGPQTNVVSAPAWKECPLRHVNVQTSLPPAMEQFL